jgi:hypothetical protein
MSSSVLLASATFKQAVDRIDYMVKAYNAILGDLGLALVAEAREETSKVLLELGKTVSSMEEVQNKLHNLPHDIVDVFAEGCHSIPVHQNSGTFRSLIVTAKDC